MHAVLTDLVGAETDQEAFWAAGRTDLQAGRIRLLFVADRDAPALRVRQPIPLGPSLRSGPVKAGAP